MDRLLPISPFIDPVIKELTQKSFDKLTSILIVLRRIRPTWNKFFEDFVSFLKKIEKQDPDFYIYPEYLHYLTKECSDPTSKLFHFLEKHGYNENSLSSILQNKTYDEGAFINRLPKQNAWFLWLCIFYLLEPRLTQKFFMNKLIYSTDENEEELVALYRMLDDKSRNKVIKILKDPSLHKLKNDTL